MVDPWVIHTEYIPQKGTCAKAMAKRVQPASEMRSRYVVIETLRHRP